METSLLCAEALCITAIKGVAFVVLNIANLSNRILSDVWFCRTSLFCKVVVHSLGSFELGIFNKMN